MAKVAPFLLQHATPLPSLKLHTPPRSTSLHARHSWPGLVRCAVTAPTSTTTTVLHDEEPFSLATLEYIHVHKTERLLEAAAVCGAIVAGGDDEEVEGIRRYARYVGLLFQVVDDVLDVTRTSEQLGKTAGKDVATDKATYPKLMGVDGARAYAAELVASAEAEPDRFDATRTEPLRHLARFIAYRQH